MSIASSIAVSGLNVATLRLQVSASNVANYLSGGPLPGSPNVGNFPPAYTALRVDQTDLAGGGTGATVRTVIPSYMTTYDPTAPYADSRGMVASPNVDLANEAIQQLLAHITFAANAQVIHADANMMANLIDISV